MLVAMGFPELLLSANREAILTLQQGAAGFWSGVKEDEQQ